jgi:tetratricopeptide (TPR) repeat protein
VSDSTSKFDQALFEKGLAFFSKAKYVEALSYFEKISTERLLILKHFYTGLCLIQMGRLEEGLAVYKKIHEIPPEILGVQSEEMMYKLYLNMGSVLQVLARRKKNKTLFQEAKTCYDYALQIMDDDAKVWNNYGNICLDLENYEEATIRFKKAIELDDEFAEPHYCLSLVYEFTHNYDQAIIELETALKMKPDDKIIMYRIAALCLGQAMFEKAKEYAKKAVDSDPKNVQANKLMALVLYNLQEYPEAYKYYQKVLELKPDWYDRETDTIFADLKKRVNP